METVAANNKLRKKIETIIYRLYKKFMNIIKNSFNYKLNLELCNVIGAEKELCTQEIIAQLTRDVYSPVEIFTFNYEILMQRVFDNYIKTL